MLKTPREHYPAGLSGSMARLWCLVLLVSSTLAKAQETIDMDVTSRIRDAALNHSQVMDIIGYLTDVTGPRLTGSPNLKRAQEYARDRLRGWGLGNAHLEGGDPLAAGGHWKDSRRT